MSAEVRAELERHLDTCAPCTRLVGELARLATGATVDASGVEAPRTAAPRRPAPKRYRIIRELGAGAMGVVWEAEDKQLARRVALKFVRPDGAADRGRRARLLREARALAQLRHPNVVAVHDVGHTDGASGEEMFVALELVKGTNARAWLAARPRSRDEILAVWRQAASGLAAVHRAGIVHRDIKPDNVFVADDGRVVLGDFGLATGELGADSVAGNMTETGAVVGTPLYMAPEQLHGDPATAQSDQFALCVWLWEALTGARPYQGATLGALAVAMMQPAAVPPAAPDRALLRVLARGVDPEPANRWPDVDALLAAIDAPPAAGRRRTIAVAVAVAGTCVVAGAVAFAALRGGEPTPAAPPAAASAVPPAPSPSPAPSAAPAPSPSPPSVPAAPVPAPIAPRVTPAPASKSSPPSPPSQLPAKAAPDQVAAKPVYDDRPTWRETHDRAADRLAFGDGKGCLQLLAASDPPPDGEADRDAKLRASCRMAAGDCPGGRAAFTSYARAHGWAATTLATELDEMDLVNCTIDAPPASRWPARARYRLDRIARTDASCKAVLAKIHALGIVLPDPREGARLEATCLARDGDCAAARAKFREGFVPASVAPGDRPRIEQVADQTFARDHPACPAE